MDLGANRLGTSIDLMAEYILLFLSLHPTKLFEYIRVYLEIVLLPKADKKKSPKCESEMEHEPASLTVYLQVLFIFYPVLTQFSYFSSPLHVPLPSHTYICRIQQN